MLGGLEIVSIASAAAALFSAIAALLLWRAQVHTLRESVRPELVLTGWSVVQDLLGEPSERIAFSGIRNVGKGPALHVNVSGTDMKLGKSPSFFLSTVGIPFIGPGETAPASGQISVDWSNATQIGESNRMMRIVIEALYWDSRNCRHELNVELMALESGAAIAPDFPMAAGRYVVSRRTVKIVPVWRLRWRNWISKLHPRQWRTDPWSPV